MYGELKSKFDVRKFAVESAIAYSCRADKKLELLEQAKEIEAYVLGEAELPEYVNSEDALTKTMNTYLAAIAKPQTDESHTAVSAESTTC